LKDSLLIPKPICISLTEIINKWTPAQWASWLHKAQGLPSISLPEFDASPKNFFSQILGMDQPIYT
jgi:hypothetical protein